MQSYRVSDWMSSPALVVPPTLTLAEARRLMEQRHVRRLPVVEDGHLVGIVSWGDLRAAQPSNVVSLAVLERQAYTDLAPIAQVMTAPPLVIEPDAPVLEAARIMLERRVSGLPVVAKGRVVGVITESDLFRLLISDATGAAVDTTRTTITCHHCGASRRGRSVDTIGPDDQCWSCHYHLHRCGNCRYYNGVSCMLDRSEQFTPVAGQHCPMFSYVLPEKGQAVSH